MKKQFIDISGFVYSGKSSISDILREVEGFIVPDVAEEFDLLRIPNGLIDLKNSVTDWSPIRTYAALNRFEKVATEVGTQYKFPEKYFKHSLNYQARYPRYFPLLKTFIDEITYHSWTSPWPYSHFEDGPIETFQRKVSEKLGYIKLRNYRLINKQIFLSSAQKFTSNLLWSNYENRSENTLVTHNALEPFNPNQNSDLLSNCKCIVVDRDPRDIYATAQIIPPGQADKLNRYRNMCAGHDVQSFIKRYQLYRSLVVPHPNVLRLEFSDIVLNYEDTLKKLFSFLNIDSSLHKNKMTSFKPEISSKTNGLYKDNKVKEFYSDFVTIEKALNL